MNLTNYRQTSIYRVVETIRREAKKHKVNIHHSELVGLIPQEALMDAAVACLQLDLFKPDQILESHLSSPQPSDLQTFDSAQGKPSTFLDDLAAGTPAPGGGSAAAHAGAMGAALVAMVARLTIGKKNYQAVQSQMNEILKQAERLRAELTEAVQADSAAFEAVMAAFKLPKKTEKEESNRNTAIEEATKGAAQVPLIVSQNAVSVMALAERAVALGNLNAITDAASAAALARASLTAASYNVRVNIASLSDEVAGDSFLNQLRALEDHAAKLEADIQRTLNERGKLSLA
jgi:glutamate formiminotransferase/formiminotetrahydrofolate cyclodeaminase